MTTDMDARLQKLIRRLKFPDDVKRIHAGLLLGRMGSEAREAAPTLLELLHGACPVGHSGTDFRGAWGQHSVQGTLFAGAAVGNTQTVIMRAAVRR